ncbi:MAG: hypothetical protein OXE95_10125 [Chloroflexi bacterium]|nr:hypothetical protein [Chloroflexota bacterium]MCY4247916.1 hypothetical protein [Chloroflexota bacterium]
MSSATSKVIAGGFVFAALLVLAIFPSAAGDIALSLNSGDENEVFWIEGEPSLVMNGFDLSAFADDLPVALDAVTLSVETPVPGGRVVVVVYEDATGGSPRDATLAYREVVSIGASGNVRIALSEPAFVNETVAWVGFYLPVGFRFYADTSGASSMTYWAWTPGGPFDLSSPARAVVLGPGDGSAPVNIQMDGIARIGIELREATSLELARLAPLGRQVADDAEVDISNFRDHHNCPGFLWEPGSSSLNLTCRVGSPVDTPVVIQDAPEGFIDVQREGTLYKLIAENYSALPEPVMHCIRVPEEHLETAVIGEARDIPERWYILPSVRYGDMVCADISAVNYVSYFLPRSPGAVQNVNLVIGWSRVAPHPAICGLPLRITASVVNTGREEFFTDNGNFQISVENIHLKSGFIHPAKDITVPAWRFKPGDRRSVLIEFLNENELVRDGSTIHDLYRLQVRIDSADQVAETNESDNTWFTEYTFSPVHSTYQCFDRVPDDGSPAHYPPICSPENYHPRYGQGVSPGHNINLLTYDYAVQTPLNPNGFGFGLYGYCNCLDAHYYNNSSCTDDYIDYWHDRGALDFEQIGQGLGACEIRAESGEAGDFRNRDSYCNCLANLPGRYAIGEAQCNTIWDRVTNAGG